MTTSAELDRPTVVVTPGGETATTLTVRNDSDIVEAYEFEVLGECAPWTTVEPVRLSLYPGTSENVTVLLRPPRSPDVRAGEVPLGIRVLPVERPQTGVISESTVIIEPFLLTGAELVPQRRRAWRRARYSVLLHNLGNTPITGSLAAADTEQQLRFRLPAQLPEIAPGTREPIRLRARARKLIWFGRPVTRAFRVEADLAATMVTEPDVPEKHALDGEFVQLPLLPRWLLALLAALLALVLAWFALVRPAIQSAATEAAEDKAQQIAQAAGQQPRTSTGDQPPGGSGGGGGAPSSQPPASTPAPGPPPPAGLGQQSSATIEVRTNPGGRGTRSYVVPEGKIFRITDILLANPQGDEGLLTIVFGERTITTIALETFRNQDYHWVTPIEVPAGAIVDATVTCNKPGTPASGVQARSCLQLLNVSGELVDQPQ
ncbi:hypothetical protein JOF56_005205 [Kibdelosporangium banguiense]|uniref:Hydrolytic protein n=1 Tax=Kibdelosporangium banguiense TaxID=1365924 RepID=A0ABS4TK78_9PSEU|nr:hydrolytic protein [Kibdelosporangium banguiense]MBP2324820.1 hypothetical protein [Kibdelosporangium banguiense]